MGARIRDNTKVVPHGPKIADITHADILEHSLTPAALGLPDNVTAIYYWGIRMGGAGAFEAKSASGGPVFPIGSGSGSMWFKAADGLFYYELSVANDDWDIYAVGYLYGTDG